MSLQIWNKINAAWRCIGARCRSVASTPARKYQYDLHPTYTRRFSFVTAHHMFDVKMYKWSFWGERNEKLRDIVIQCKILHVMCVIQGKRLGLNLRYPMPPELQWFKQELIKAGADIYIDGRKD